LNDGVGGNFSLGLGWVVVSIWAVMFRNAKIRKEELKKTKRQMKELTDVVKENKKA
jgi:uncharacterized membrane protein (DUF106 family)